MLTALVSMGCTGQLHRSASVGASPCSFWPPPQSTSVSTAEVGSLAPRATLADVAAHMATVLRDAGHDRPRFYPVGLGYRHGFAITTRLESIDGDGRPSTHDRWSPSYPDASTLRWLAGARAPRLPRPGRYRAFLIAFTDLPIGHSSIAPVWNELTVMEGPGVVEDISPRDLPAERPASASYRLGFYVYEYRREDADAHGDFVPTEASRSAVDHVRGAGLSKLAGTLFDADPRSATW